ncbi:MAG: SPOR domain-containing protein [Pseudomonadota bacterium]
MTGKVLRAERRIVSDPEKLSKRRSYATYAWALAALGSIGLAGYSFTSGAFAEKSARYAAVDQTITGSVGRSDALAASTPDRGAFVASGIEAKNAERLDLFASLIKQMRTEQKEMSRELTNLSAKIGEDADIDGSILSNTDITSGAGGALSGQPVSVSATQASSAGLNVAAQSPEAEAVDTIGSETLDETASTQDPLEISAPLEIKPPAALGSGGAEARSVPVSRIANEDAPALIRSPGEPRTDTAASSVAESFGETQPDASNLSARGIDSQPVGSIGAITTLFALDLGINPTEARARSLWNDLTREQPGVLTKLQPRYVPTKDEDGQTRLIAGPYENAADAIRDCVELRRIEAFCKTTLFR